MSGAERQYQPGELVPGTIYRVLRHLATGGMGSVYDVEDTTVGKRYVLKTLHPNLVSRSDLARRMAAEARTLGRLAHPNIVEVVTAGQTTDTPPLPYYVMERLNGQNLRSVLEKRGSLPEDQALPIAIELLDALDHAHEHQVVHRDVKPDNIFLHRSITGAIVTKLLDFGIMRMVDESRTSDTSGRFVGTLRYAAPEQLLGGQVGPGTDLYAAAIVMYEMLAGKGPFDDTGDIARMGFAHLNERPAPLSKLVRVSVEVERVIMSALEKAPQDRPRDAFTFAAQLKAIVKRDARAGARVQETATDVHVLSELPGNAVPARPMRGAVDLAEAVTVAAVQSANRPAHDPSLPFAQTAMSDAPVGFAFTTPDEPRAHAATLPSSDGRRPNIDRQADTRSLAPSAIAAMAAGGIGSTERLASAPFADRSPPSPSVRGEVPIGRPPMPRAPSENPSTSQAVVATTTSGSTFEGARSKERPVWPFFVFGMVSMLVGGGALLKLVVAPRLAPHPVEATPPASVMPLAPVAALSTSAVAATPKPSVPTPTPSSSATSAGSSPSTRASASSLPASKTAPKPSPAKGPAPVAPRGESPDVPFP